jgi:4'-phosphopantetheinyl transferase
MIHWLVQASADLPLSHDWLTPPEQTRCAALKTEKRRREWLLGRWTAKRLMQAVLAQTERVSVPLNEFQVDSSPDGAPVAGRLQDAWARRFALSLSHSGGSAFCALVSGQAHAVGADLERIEPRSGAFVADYSTDAEIAQLDCAPAGLHDTLITALWSAKEAALKAVRLGLTVDVRAVECRLAPASVALSSWAPVDLRWDGRRVPRALPALHGWWRIAGGFVLTLAASGRLWGG